MTQRIAIVVPEYRTKAAPGGGVSTVADFVISSLSTVSEWEIEVFSPRMWSGAKESQRFREPRSWLKGPQTETGQVKGVPVTYVGSHFAEIEQLRFLSRKLLRELLSPFDLIIVISGTPAAFELVNGMDVPVLAQVATTVQVERARLITNGNWFQRIVRKINLSLSSRLDRSGVRIPQLVLVENPWMESWCRRNGAGETRIELPGVDTDFFSPPLNEFTVDGSGYIISVGRLSDHRKDFGLLLSAYDLAIREYGIEQRLVIAGRGDLPLDVYKTLDRLDLRERVEIRGDLSPVELRDLYRNADLFAMSSSEEGLGIVLLEAMSTGLPIVSTATEGAKSVVGKAGVGNLIEFGENVESRLAHGIARLANDPEVRKLLGTTSREAAVENFSLENTGNHFRQAVSYLLDK